MAANTKPSSRARRDDSGMYVRASRYREELVEEARTLRRAGKIRAAKGVESRVQRGQRRTTFQQLHESDARRRPGSCPPEFSPVAPGWTVCT